MDAVRDGGIVTELSGAFAGARGFASNLLDLFGLEARRAGLMLVLMLACGAIGGALIIAAWLGMLAALVLWGISFGFTWEQALRVVVFANLVAAGTSFWLCARASRDLAFPATRRALV